MIPATKPRVSRGQRQRGTVMAGGFDLRNTAQG
jgi:hypothetical protein